MLSKRISALLLLSAICLSSVYIVMRGGFFQRRPAEEGVTLSQAADDFVGNNFPFGEQLKQLATRFRLLSGQWDQNGVYITDGHLLDNISRRRTPPSAMKTSMPSPPLWRPTRCPVT